MNPERLLNTGIVPALEDLAKRGVPDDVNARRFLLAIALQESSLLHRRQVGADGYETGPAASFWQFEKNGGCKGVLTHRSTATAMRNLCRDFDVEPTAEGLWNGIQYNDIVAAAAARLLVFTLPHKLPTTSKDGWAQYIEAWRPGRPRPNSWIPAWDLATLVTGAEL